ncbi:TPA: sugar transferase [Clostridium perfringens]|nr:sugar transferase [Clostridium perfringens]ELC8439515.1 sugar transferase [Clostridium perfringens]MBI5987087.1 sugar transferase [Clostridium perfringens]MBI6009049.1 sugar transferase [Clostridium perfringens]PWX48092.1 exopolysaccharide biosynthesis protein [Clostridium perfringens]
MFDFISSLIGLIIFLPILIIIAVAIKLDSKGPIVFGHIRIGKNGQEIKVYKFRSMVQNAQEVFNNFTPEQKAEFNKNFKLENDPRITRVGSFLRKTSLDELPQLWNIIKGDMSVVGPRPIVKKEIIKYGDSFGKVFSVKPGLTGYWQANGRSDTTYDERVDMDLYYVDNRSLGLDFKILIQTFVSVIKKEGAM